MSDDCDIVHRGNGEPYVDVFLAVPIAEPSPLEMNARNARRLHLPISINRNVQYHEIDVWSRHSLPRESLRTDRPAGDVQMDDSTRRCFREWLGKRYDRSAMPDAFNARLEQREARRVMREILDGCADCFRDVYLAIEPDNCELSEDAPYGVRVALVMSAADAGNPNLVDRAEEGRGALEAFLRNCPGVDVESVEVWTDTDFTLADLDTYQLWDFSDLTLANDAS